MIFNGVIFLGFVIIKIIEKLNNLYMILFMYWFVKFIVLWNYFNCFMFVFFFYEKDNELNDILEYFKYDDYYFFIDYFDVIDFYLIIIEVYKKKFFFFVFCYNF